ncbi:hypothetical protein [Flammeovirga aprica]|uniref:Uncharacterized protein n=1 Tax=Flammeovirga aprica JL-4 TaxID=694437 RepID=A0A7X9RSJ2_9BACT|nr:hypothetical protein [Flammeovirga aprica]NME67141.1 hypothetical protein [Flammeovirga aprica JL-4]
MRFLPSDSLQYDTLVSYENLALFDYPLDLPIKQEGTFDPEPVNEEGFHWLYGVVPIDFELPPVDHEIIGEVFLPEYPKNNPNEEFSSERVLSDSSEYYGMMMGVELYSMYLAGHLSEEEANEFINLLEGESTSSSRKEQSVYEQFFESLKSVRNTLGSIFVTPVYAKKANPLNWCWGCIFSKGWTPNGRVQFRYNNGNNTRTVPVKGLKVVIHRGLKSIVAYTNENGDFSSYSRFASKVTYTTHFRNRNPSFWGSRYFRLVKGGLLFTHKHDMLSSTRSDNIIHTYDLTDNNFRVSNIDEMAAAIFVSAYEFYHGNRLGFQKPRNNMRIRIHDESGRGTHNTGRYWFLANQIKMYMKQNDGNHRTAESIISTTYHELGHASHYALDGRCFWSDNAFCNDRSDLQDEILKESWALLIEHHLTRQWFPNFNGDISQNLTFTQMNNSFNVVGGREGKYTSLFFDLVDTNDQSNNNTTPDVPIDRVNGYTIPQMQNALRSISTLQGLRDNLFNFYSNPSEGNLQDLIDSYNNNLVPID